LGLTTLAAANMAYRHNIQDATFNSTHEKPGVQRKETADFQHENERKVFTFFKYYL